ncbi:DUF2790 domain-containing protein [Azotobacter vinelandii]
MQWEKTMKSLAVLMMAAVPFMAMSNLVDAAEEEPDPLTADLQLVQPDDGEDVAEVHDYEAGEKLDVHKVISIESDSSVCGVTPAVMTYEDSHGATHVMRYQVMGGGCQG